MSALQLTHVPCGVRGGSLKFGLCLTHLADATSYRRLDVGMPCCPTRDVMVGDDGVAYVRARY